MLNRLRNDFQLALLTLFGVVAVVAIVPFALYRFATGNAVAGLVDLGILGCIAAAVVYGWRGGDLDRAGLVVVLTSTLGCLVISVLVGLPGALWMYPILMANFFMTRRGHAFAIAAAAVLFLALHGGAFASRLQLFAFVASALVTAMFAYIFAHRTEHHRQQLQLLATRDELTGARNRRAMEEELAAAIDARRRHGTPQGLALLDLDHFKRINDECGHEAGDRALVEFAALVSRHCRKSDGFFRFGGEEFLLLLPGAGEPDISAVAEKLRVAVAGELECGGRAVTVSIGAAALRPDESWQAWLARADAALYRAKRGGRNRVVLAVEDEPAVVPDGVAPPYRHQAS